MPKMPLVSAVKLLKILENAGFRQVRQKGSHIVLMNDKGTRTVVPFHKGKDIKPSLVRAIIQEAGLTRDEFFELLEKS